MSLAVLGKSNGCGKFTWTRYLLQENSIFDWNFVAMEAKDTDRLLNNSIIGFRNFLKKFFLIFKTAESLQVSALKKDISEKFETFQDGC